MKQIIKQEFEDKINGILERNEELKHLPQALPESHFTKAAFEAKKMYLMGYYYGSISISQSVAEALARFIAEKYICEERYYIEEDERNAGVKQAVRIEHLKQEKKISQYSFSCFRKILESHRNSIHHMISDMPQKDEKLRKLAKECIVALFNIENIVSYFLENGKLFIIDDCRMWESEAKDLVKTYIDFTYI